MSETKQPPILCDSAETRHLLGGISRQTLHVWNTTGRIPRPAKVGGKNLWRRAELEEWAAAGCPPRIEWENRLTRSAT